MSSQASMLEVIIDNSMIDWLIDDSIFTGLIFDPHFDNCLQAYVQSIIPTIAEKLIADVSQRGAHIYVCGDVGMAAGVHDAVKAACLTRGFSEDEAVKLLDNLRVRTDTWEHLVILCLHTTNASIKWTVRYPLMKPAQTVPGNPLGLASSCIGCLNYSILITTYCPNE